MVSFSFSKILELFRLFHEAIFAHFTIYFVQYTILRLVFSYASATIVLRRSSNHTYVFTRNNDCNPVIMSSSKRKRPPLQYCERKRENRSEIRTDKGCSMPKKNLDTITLRNVHGPTSKDFFSACSYSYNFFV